MQAIEAFCFLYPLLFSWLWIAGALFFWFRFERLHCVPTQLPVLGEFPRVAVVAPCFNEEDHVIEVIENLLAHRYSNFEVIAVNDGSTDNTGALLDQLAAQHRNLRVIHNKTNQGKAVALTSAAKLTRASFLLCIDGDALLDQNATVWMLYHFLNSPRVGAITGNPRLRNRTTLLGKLQVGEFSSIIGLIKRAQRTYGRLFTVSGVCAMFRKSALEDVGYWSKETLTEDIDISWKLQIRHWDVRFEPAATCWILMPETIRGLWKQRLRWAIGGVQAFVTYRKIWSEWKSRRMWAVYIEFTLSLIWSYAIVGMGLYSLFYHITINEESQWGFLFETQLAGSIIGLTSLFQACVAASLDSKYDIKIWRNLPFFVLYPLFYWLIGTLTTVCALPLALKRGKTKRGRWISPDRGFRKNDTE